MRVLVTAASLHGSTTEIARAIGEELSSKDLESIVVAPEKVNGFDGIDAVVLGSAVYAGHWLAPAMQVVDRLAQEHGTRPVWLFSSGPVGDPHRKLVQKMGADPVDLPKALSATGAQGHKMFAGRLDRHDLHGPQRVALVIFRGMEGDFRDWDEIKTWARSIADQLAGATPS